MELLSQSLHFRLDVLLTLALAIIVAIFCHAALSTRSTATRKFPPALWIIAAILLMTGALAAEWIQRQREQATAAVLAGFGPTYANELRKLGHASITLSTAPDDPVYQAALSAQREWLRLNPLIADIYTFRRDSTGHFRLIVDSETDYNHNGVIDGDREKRTPIGEPYTPASDTFSLALQGQPSFNVDVQTDRWGQWISSYAPLYNTDGTVEAAIGIDYPADHWLSTIAIYRALVLGVCLALISLTFAGSTVVTILRAEIHERKRTTLQLAEAKELADLASRSKSEFLAVMTHEIRTPLTAVMGFTSVLSETELDRTQHRYLATIASAGDRMNTMLNDILDLTKIEEGRLHLESSPFQPRRVFDEVIDLMTPYALEKGLSLKYENLPPSSLSIEGDAPRVRQIIINLVSNALKFTDHGSVTLKTEWAPPSTLGHRGVLTLHVADTGIGIESSKLKDLFETFSQTHGGTRRYNGRGLGLSICQRLATLMGGTIRVRTIYTAGSTFTVELPFSLGTASPSAPALVLESTPPPSARPTTLGRALVVDDQAINREILKAMLHRLGYTVETVNSGEDAVLTVAKNTYDFVLMDLEMPGVDGYVATRRIRAGAAFGQHVPIIAVTATTTRGTRERCLEAGMDDYLTKPVYQPALISTLDALVASRKAPAASHSVA